MSSTPLKILFVDDNYDQYVLINDLLSANQKPTFALEWSAEYADALEKLRNRSYDAALIDYYLNGQSGLDLVKEALTSGCKSPLIIITGRGDADLDAEVMKSSAADYLEKSDLRPSTLVRAIRYAIERANVTRSLRESEERYRDLFENSTDLIQSVDHTGRFVYVNRAWHRTLGYSPDELNNCTMFDMLRHDYVEYCRAKFQQALIQQEALPVEFIFLAKDRREVIVEGNITTKVLPDSSAIIRGIFHDITERTRAEKALKASEERLRMVIKSLPVFLFTVDKDGTFRLGEGKMNEIPGFDSTLLHGLHIAEIFEAVLGVELSDAQRDQITRAQEGEDGILLMTIFKHTYEIHYGPMRNENGEFIGIIGVSIEVTSLKQAEAAEHAQRLLAESLYSTAAAINSTLHFEEILDRILINVGKVFPHDVAEIMMIEGDTAVIVRSHSGTEGVSSNPDVRLHIASTVNLPMMISTRQPMIISDTQKFKGWLDVPTSRWMRSYAGIPIQSEGKVIGFLNLGSKTPDFFSDDHISNLQVFSDQIAIAIQNARYYEQAQELAAINERQRLARELHDAVSQTLFSASVIAESLPRIVKDLPTTIQDGLGELHLLNRRALAEMRSLLLELRPKALVETKLEDLLRQLAETFVSRQPLEMKLDLTENLTMSTDVKIALYRIAQEAFNNIAKHARAVSVSLSLRQVEGALQLQVTDDGRGFDMNDTLPDSFGISIMRERTKGINGTLRITSNAANGTSVTVTVPNSQ